MRAEWLVSSLDTVWPRYGNFLTLLIGVPFNITKESGISSLGTLKDMVLVFLDEMVRPNLLNSESRIDNIC